MVDGFIFHRGGAVCLPPVPQVREYLFLSHASYEVGYQLAAGSWGWTPACFLEMRLGEGAAAPWRSRF